MRRRVSWRAPRPHRWLATASLALLMLLLQACDNGNGFNPNGNGISTSNNAKFAGELMFVKAGNIFIFNGADDKLKQVTFDGDSFQPSLSRDGKTIAFELHKPGNDYSDLATMPLSGGTPTLHTDNRLLCKCDPDQSGVYHYEFWAGNPIWTGDGQNLIFLSDFFKGMATTPTRDNRTCPYNADKDYIQDLGIAEIPANAQALPAVPVRPARPNPPKQLAWPYCYAGGDQDLSLRPGVSDTEVLFTSFEYIPPQQSDLGAQISLLILPNDSKTERIIQLSPLDAKSIPLEPSFSPDGRYITYIRRENSQDNLYIMPVDATITGTPNDESYLLEDGTNSVYYTNTDYYMKSQLLASGIIGQPVWGSNNTLFFTIFDNGEFNLYMARVKFSNPAATPTTGPSATPGTTPTASGSATLKITLEGNPVQLTQGGVDADSRPVWFSS